LAQRLQVLLITIPGNYKNGGWSQPNADRKPAYLLDRELPEAETRVRNAVYTFNLVAEGVRFLIERVTKGPVLIAGHSTGGEIQFLLKQPLARRLQGRSLGWGTGGPAAIRRVWDDQSAPSEPGGPSGRRYRSISEIRGRSPNEYVNGYVGPLNPIKKPTPL
ncbi:MAG: hypothetical protein ACRD1T_25240, partial [Acidimicrobiia bacterium]